MNPPSQRVNLRKIFIFAGILIVYVLLVLLIIVIDEEKRREIDSNLDPNSLQETIPLNATRVPIRLDSVSGKQKQNDVHFIVIKEWRHPTMIIGKAGETGTL